VVLIACRLDLLLGVPLPKIISQALEALREKEEIKDEVKKEEER
jgi:hypothetical protein